MSCIYKCIHCSFEHESPQKFSVHLYNKHKIIARDYYRDNIKTPKEGKCLHCEEEARFISIAKGYASTCKSKLCHAKAHSNSAKMMRKRIKDDPTKSEKMNFLISLNQSNIWNERRESGEILVIAEKISKTRKHQNSLLTKEELKERYDWYSKKTIEEQDDYKEKQFQTGRYKWWKTAPAEEIDEKVFSKMKKYRQGIFKPKNPQKYKGDPTRIFYRSSLELKCMQYFDSRSDIIYWQSEEVIVPYKSPIDGRYHRYFPDFVLYIKRGENIEVLMVEVKPYGQTLEPKTSSQKTSKRYINEVMTWGVNSSKWAAAEEYCKDKGWKFQIITEKDINNNKQY